MNERDIQNFWHSHPCGDQLVGGLADDYAAFFNAYDDFRYRLEGHILKCLDQINFKGKQTLEIGLGQGADSEQLIRRGARWSGLDLTEESVARVQTRLDLKRLPYENLRHGSAVTNPYPDQAFDVVYSHGVLHHIPEIKKTQAEIARVLKPGGELVMMVYAKHSLNYWAAIFGVRRLGLLLMALLRLRPKGIYGQHLANVEAQGLCSYLRMKNFIHANTDGPLNPYSKVYTVGEIQKDFPAFEVVRTHKEFMHAPPLPVHGVPGARLMGWHLWAHLRKKV